MSRSNLKILGLVIFVAGIISFVMCKKDVENAQIPQSVFDMVSEPETFKEIPRQDRIEEIISDTSYWKRYDELPDDWDKPSRSADLDTCHTYNVLWNCKTVKVSASENPDDFAMVDPQASVLWPGNLVQGASLESGVPTSIPVSVTKRQPGNISLAIVSSSGEVGDPMFMTVDKMQFSSVNQAMNDILRGYSGTGPARYVFDYKFIENSDDLEFNFNASFKGFGASARAKLSTNYFEKNTIILLKFHQSYFTMVYDDPAGLDGVFTPDISVNDLRNYTGNGNPICYISSVTYGRIFYVLYESSASKDSLEAALNLAYSGFGADAAAEAKLSCINTLQKTTASVFLLGGNASNSFTHITALNLESIIDFLNSGTNFSAQNPGAPISYTVKYLKNAQLVRMNNTLGYEVDRCVPEMTKKECPELPQLTTMEVTTYTHNTATMGGNIKLEGVPPYYERGVVYFPVQDPDNPKKEIISGSGVGSFSRNISGLIPSTDYYVKAFATNTEGTAYGEQVRFTTEKDLPRVETSQVTTYTASTANLGGNIVSTGNPPYFERGVIYDTSQNPEIDNPNKTPISGTGTGSFNTTVSGLVPNTPYFVRAYAINADGVSYGKQEPFRTLDGKPAVTTNPVSNLTSTSVTFNGSITDAGTPAYTKRGFFYGTTKEPTTNETQVSGNETGDFYTNITELTVNTTYYVRAYVTNTAGTSYGKDVEFKTGLQLALTTNDVTVYDGRTATLGGNITNQGTPQYIERGVVHSTNSNPEIGGSGVIKTIIPGFGTGPFEINVSGFTPLTQYFVRAYAINADGTKYGDPQKTFTTKGILPTLTTNEAGNVTHNSATLGGNITDVGIPAYIEKGVVYANSSPPSTANDKKVVQSTGSGTGNYSVPVTSLTPNTTYYVQAYAINTSGTSYGTSVPFTTVGGLPILTTNDATNISARTAILNGYVTDIGTPAYYERGFVYGTNSNPTITNSTPIQVSGSGIGDFSVSVSNLNPVTVYYVRAYAINEIGVGYGDPQKSFTTLVDGVYYRDANGIIQLRPQPLNPVYESTTTLSGSSNGGWYYLTDGVTVDTRITVSGNVHLILTDSYNFTASEGINVTGSGNLTIYGQELGTGSLTAIGSSGNAGIGGNVNESNGIVTINSGNVTASGGSAENGGTGGNNYGGVGAGAGIGGGGGSGGGTGASGSTGGGGGTITINPYHGDLYISGKAPGSGGSGGGFMANAGGGGGGGSAAIGGGGGGGGGGIVWASMMTGHNGNDGSTASSYYSDGGRGGDGGRRSDMFQTNYGGAGGEGGTKGTYNGPTNKDVVISTLKDGSVRVEIKRNKSLVFNSVK